MNLTFPENQSLLPFQVTAIQQMITFLQSNEANGVYNACEMGLGKSVQAIVACNTLEFKRVLIICPAVMRLTWVDELAKWSTLKYEIDFIAAILTSKELLETNLESSQILVVSYDLAAKPEAVSMLSSIKWDCLILDEMHYLKSFKAKRTKAVLKDIWPAATYHICLSGTPFTQSVVDGFTAFNKLCPSKFPRFSSFVEQFSYIRPTPWGNKYYGVKNPEILSKIIRESFYLRYRKDEVLLELPDKVFNRITLGTEYSVAVGKPEKAALEGAVQDVIARLKEGQSAGVLPASLAAQKRLQGVAKVPAVSEFVRGLLEQEIPVVLFAWHTSVIERFIYEFHTYTPAVITGSTAMGHRQDAIKRFQGGETNLFIGQMAAAGVGITLTRASNVVLAELDWSPAVVSQAIDRCHRIGQKDSVNVHFFVVKESIEERIVGTLMEKVKTFNKVLEN